MDDFKVSLESLYTNKIKEISFEEEETYQEKSTLSQRLIDLAQRVDFREAAGEEGAEPSSKKPVQQWPWQQANSKLRMALTEASVLTDIIQIVQHQQKYVALNQVVTLPTSMTTPSYQFVMKKRALSQAAAILHKGMESLSVSSTDREREFHRAIAALRQRWRLKRVGSGVIVGDLSYRSAGSVYAGNVMFDVYKNTEQSGSNSDVVKVNIPRELRGASEILVFLSPQPINEVSSLSEFPCPVSASDVMQIEGVAEGGAGSWKETLSSVQLQLSRAQNVLFNQELFTQLAKEAYDQKLDLQHEVTTSRINIPFSQDCWLSIIYVHERDHTPSASNSSPSSTWPPPRWDLVVALKQLLRESHRQRATLAVPRPSTMGFQDFTDAKSADLVRNAGVIPIKGKEFKELATVKKTLFSQFFAKAKHLYNEERLQRWLKELQESSEDLTISFTWKPHPSLTSINVQLLLQDSLATTTQDKDCVVKILLKVDKVTIERRECCGGNLTFTLQKDKLLSVLKHYITYLHMLNALKLAEEKEWRVTQEVPRPHLSSILAKSREVYPESCNLLLESGNAQLIVEILFSWNSFTVDRSRFVEDESSKGTGIKGCGKWETERVKEAELVAHTTTKDKLVHLLTVDTLSRPSKEL